MQVKLRDLNGNLQSAVQNLWASWHALLNVSLIDRDKFLCDILKINVEKNNAIAEMRVGLLTVEIIAESILFLLIVAVALGGVNARWDVVIQDLEAKLIGLKYWGGTNRDISVRELFYEDDDETVELIIGGETKPILVLPHIKSSSSEFYSASLQDDKSGSDSLISSKRPKLLVTKSRKLDGLIRAGDLDSIREELEKELFSKLASREKNIMSVGSGDVI